VDLRIVLVVMREYSVMHAHRVRESIALQVLDGELRLHTPEQIARAHNGALVTFERGVVHEIEAFHDSAFLLYLPWSNHVSLRERESDHNVEDRKVDEAVLASMPASDPPPWTSLHAGSPSRNDG
jgi:hypothetical protein